MNWKAHKSVILGLMAWLLPGAGCGATAERGQPQTTRSDSQDLAKPSEPPTELRTRGVRIEPRGREYSGVFASFVTKEEPRGLVITLSSSGFFHSGQATLLLAAQDRLRPVAEALVASWKGTLTVEDHTDSKSSRSDDQLSQHRADVVRSYLISSGYPADQIQAHGIGMEHPVADNASFEGRAKNRRVEIIIANARVQAPDLQPEPHARTQ